mgnify:CR=1 FL=1
MKVTAQWIAEQCGVSRGTVDRVVNGRPNVAPEVRERVQKIISEYGYKTPSQRQAAREKPLAPCVFRGHRTHGGARH